MSSSCDRKVKVAELVLRCLICGLGVVAAVLVGTDSQVRNFFSVQKKAKFTDMKALLFLVVASGLAAGYCLLQGVHCVVNIARGTLLFNKPLAWVIFSFDQAMAYVMLSAVAASMQSAVFSKKGQTDLQWMEVCNMYSKFCMQVGEGVASAVLISVGLVVLSSMSAFNLFRLYGNVKEKSNGGW